MTSSLSVAGVDVSGTNIEVGLVDEAHQVQAKAKASTPAGGPEDVLDTVAELVSSLDRDCIAVGVGIPGVVHEGQVLTVPNLPNWTGPVDLVGPSSGLLGVSVALGNDANVGLLGEWLAGVARRAAMCWDCGWAPAWAAA